MIQNRTKIIATVGPACIQNSTLKKMVLAGTNAFRVNMSHGSQKDKKEIIQQIKQLKTPNGERPCIIADLAGPKIRVRNISREFEIKKKDTVFISSDESEAENTIIVSNGIKFSKVKKGASIKINDGRIQLKVEQKLSPTLLQCITAIGGKIEKGKGVNFPGVTLQLSALTNQDHKDLKLAITEKVDWIALSFVRSANDKAEIDGELKKQNSNIPIIAKIEKWEALQDLDAIIDKFDAVMVARGDLGVETPPEQVPLAQNK